MCRECKRFGRSREATTVHHIFPLEHYPEYRLTTDNLISCCAECHNSFHDRDSHELTARGKQLQDTVKEKVLGNPAPS